MKHCISLILMILFSIASLFAQEFSFENGVRAHFVKNSNLIGVVDERGQQVVPSKYGTIKCIGNTLYCQKKDNKRSNIELYNYKGVLIISESDGCSRLSMSKVQGKDYMYWTERGKVTMNGLFPQTIPDKTMLYNGDGQLVARFIHQSSKFADPITYSLFDEVSNSQIVELGIYTSPIDLYEGYLRTKVGDKVAILRQDGSVLIPPILYKSIVRDTGGRHGGFKVKLSSDGGSEGYIDESGKCIIPVGIYDVIHPQKDGTFNVQVGTKEGVLESDGTLRKIEGKSYPLSEEKKNEEEREGFKWTEISRGRGYTGIEYKGKTIIPCEYDFIMAFVKDGELLFSVEKNHQKGVIDSKGKVLIPVGKYDFISTTSDPKYFKVERMGKEGVCDRNGKEIMPPTYSHIYIDEKNDVVYVYEGYVKGLTDMHGRLIIPIEYTDIDIEDGYYRTKLYGKYGAHDARGKMIVPPIYTYLRAWDYEVPADIGKVIRVEQGKTVGLYSLTGDLIFPADKYCSVKIQDVVLNGKNQRLIKAHDNGEGDSKTHWFKTSGEEIEIDGQSIKELRTDAESILFAKAQEAFGKKDYSKAINYYQESLQWASSSDKTTILYNIAAAYYNSGDYSRAIEYAEKSKEAAYTDKMKEDAQSFIEDCNQARARKRVSASSNNSTLPAANVWSVAESINNSSSFMQSFFYAGPSGSFPPGLDPRLYAAFQKNMMAEFNSQMEYERNFFMNNYRYIYSTSTGMAPSEEQVFNAYTQYLQSSITSSSDDSSSSSFSNVSTTTSSTVSTSSSKCGFCGGSGREIRDGAVSFGLANKKYCKECGKEVFSSHYHTECRVCHGKGY